MSTTPTTPDKTATTWRDLQDDLTFDQVGWMLNFESNAKGDPADVADVLLDAAREHVEKNRVDAERFAHLPTPAAARKVFHWEDDGEGHWTRQFSGTRAVIERPLPQYPKSRNRLDISIEGVQDQDGTIDRYVHMYTDGTQFTSVELRQLAATATNMADELDRLDR
ncbi:hypothetical protein [Mycobacterium interjectum]|uniref:hypothetical protein n=1 Tax=Mycobacterium interjectum TaxID=33895 RepID=UPI0008337151|nr:hypothetical protein [Mycobacterium interjectum]MCV7090195.1 hypothetical protein [Mycobacterium interjectum]